MTGPARRIRIESVALIGILWLALALRLIWMHAAGFVYDVDFFVRAMRLAARGGAGLVFSATESSYPPLTVYLLELLGRFSLSAAPGVPTMPSELLALRVATIFFDLVIIAVLYGLGRRIAGYTAAIGAALLYALCPGGIYLSGWWGQIDAWYVLPMVLGGWWLSQRRVALAWIALALAIALKLQAVVVLPVFIIGTWRWYGLRRLVVGSVALVLTLGVMASPLLLRGQAADLPAKTTQVVGAIRWMSIESHNLWFALIPGARDLHDDANNDLNRFVGGVSFRDAGLSLLALGYGLILSRLFVRSGPRAVFAACAVAWLVFFILPTRIDARYFFPALALMLCAGFYQRRWWGLYCVMAVTLLINLVWKSRAISPLTSVLSITLEGAVVSAWINVAVLGLALAFYLVPVLRPVWHQAQLEGMLRVMERGWEMSLLGLATSALLVILATVLWRGRSVGAQIALLQPPLRASLDATLDGQDTPERMLVVNWPHTISAGRSADLGGIIPVTPAAFFLPAPDTLNRGAIWVQYQPWQHTPGLEIEYYGTFVTQGELARLVQQAERVVTFSPQKRQMYVLAQRQPAITPSACLVSFDDRVCLAAAHATSQDSLLQIGLTWQVTGTLSSDVTVFVHIADLDGKLVVQADGDLVGGLTPMAGLGVMDMALYETRLLAVPAGNHRVLIGLYDRASGNRLTAQCAPSNLCMDNAVQVP